MSEMIDDSDLQLLLWLDGDARHRGVGPDGECCPDFSCCTGHIAPRHEREKFVEKYCETGEDDIGMLMTFLSRTMNRELGENHGVHIAGRDPDAN